MRRGSPSSLVPRPLETFAHGLSLQAPSGGALVCPSLAIFSAIWPWEIRDFTWAPAWEMEIKWRGAGRRDEKMEDIGRAGLPIGITKRRDAADPPRSETKKVTDKELTRNRPDPVRNTCTWMKTTSYGKTKQQLFEGLLLGLILLSTQAQAESIICCEAHNAQCLSCKEGKSIEVYCNKDPFVPGCEEYLSDAIRAPMPMPFGRRLQVDIAPTGRPNFNSRRKLASIFEVMASLNAASNRAVGRGKALAEEKAKAEAEWRARFQAGVQNVVEAGVEAVSDAIEGEDEGGVGGGVGGEGGQGGGGGGGEAQGGLDGGKEAEGQGGR